MLGNIYIFVNDNFSINSIISRNEIAFLSLPNNFQYFF